MTSDLGLGITLSLRDQFSSKSQKVSRSMGNLRKGAKDTVSVMKRMQGAMTALAGATIFMAGKRVFMAVTNSAATFEKGMTEVSTLVDTTQINMKKLGQQTIALSKKFGLPAVEEASALYQVLSAGVGDASESMQVLEVANKIAIGGVTDVTTAVDGLTTILNAWKLKASDAENVADTLFTTMKLGKTTIPELSSFIFQAAPLASQLGVSLEELGAAIVTMTKQGTKTPIAMTQIRNALVAMLRPTDDLNKIWKKFGFTSGASAIKAMGLQKALQAIVTEAKGDEGILTKLLGSQEAVQATLQLTGSNTKVFNQTMDEMKKKSGATSEAVSKMQNTHDNRIARMKASLEALKITIGNRLLVAMSPLIKKVSEFINKADIWLKKHPKITKVIAGSIGVVTVLGVALGAVAAVMGVITLISVPVLVAFAKIAAVIGIVIAAFVALKPVFLELWQQNQDVVNKLKAAWTGFKNHIWPVIRNVISAFIHFQVAVLGTVLRTFNKIIQFVKPILSAWWKETQANLQFILDAWTIFKAAMDPVIKFIVKIFGAFKTGVGTAINGVIGFIQGLIDKIVNFIDKIPLIKKAFSIIGKIFNFGKKIIGSAADTIVSEIKEINQSIKDGRDNIHILAENIRKKNSANQNFANLNTLQGQENNTLADSSSITFPKQQDDLLSFDKNPNFSLVAAKNPNLNSFTPEIKNEVTVPQAKIETADIILDKQKLGKVIFEMQQLQTIRSN